MTGMGMTQLPTPDFTAGRPEASPADNRSDRRQSDAGRFDDVARQQQKQLDAKAEARRQDRADARQPTDKVGAGRASETPGASAKGAAQSEPGRGRQAERAAAGADALDASVEVDPSELVPDFAAMSFEVLVEPTLPPSPMPAPPGSLLAGAGLPGQLAAAFTGDGSEGALASRDLFLSLQQTASGQGQLQDGNFMDLLKAPSADRLASSAQLEALNPASQSQLRAMEPGLMRGYATSVEVPVGAADWGEKVMGKLTWLTAAQMTVAEIHVTPPELGPLDVRVQVQNDQATVTVHASTPAVRDQLEAQSQRLRDMLAEQGLHLQGFDVTDSGTRERSGESAEEFAGNGQGGGPGSADDEGATDPGGQLDLSWKGEVDLYV